MVGSIGRTWTDDPGAPLYYTDRGIPVSRQGLEYGLKQGDVQVAYDSLSSSVKTDPTAVKDAQIEGLRQDLKEAEANLEASQLSWQEKVQYGIEHPVDTFASALQGRRLDWQQIGYTDNPWEGADAIVSSFEHQAIAHGVS